MAETFGTLKVKVRTFLQHANINDIADSDFVGTLLNMGLHTLEMSNNWKCMENKKTGTVTSSIDYINDATPLTRYKAIKSLNITVDGRQIFLRKTSYADLFNRYPYGTTSTGYPKECAYSKADGKIWVRPFPDATYSYEIITHNYTADMSSDSDTNWWTDNNGWELLMYAAIVEGGILLKDDRLQSFAEILSQKIGLLKRAEDNEEFTGSRQSVQPFVLV